MTGWNTRSTRTATRRGGTMLFGCTKLFGCATLFGSLALTGLEARSEAGPQVPTPSAPSAQSPATVPSPAAGSVPQETRGAPPATRGGLPPADELLRLMQERCVAAVKRAETAVVAVSRLQTARDSAGFRLPNLGRLGAANRLDEIFPSDADFQPSYSAAGVVVDEKGLVLTAYHALGGVPPWENSEFYVWRQHRPLRAKMLAADGWFDLAVLQVETEGADGLTWEPLPWGPDLGVRKGELAIAVGNPQGIARDGEMTAAWSLIGDVRRRAPEVSERVLEGAGRETLHNYGTLIHLNLPLQAGYAGGPLLNLDGEMVGLITAYAGQATSPQPAAFAIPVDEHFRKAVEVLKEGKVPGYGFLGVGLQPLDPKSRRAGRHGAIVESVMVGTPAARAGLQVGDLLTHIDGEPLYDDDEVIRAVSRMKAGRTVVVRLVREGDSDRGPQGGKGANHPVLEKPVRLTKRGEQAVRASWGSHPVESWRGLQIDDATAAPREALLSIQLPEHGGGFVVAVSEDSPTWNAGLRRGDFVTAVAGRTFSMASEFRQLVAEQPGTVPLQVLTAGGKSDTRVIER